MATVSSLSDEHWATTSDVRDIVEIPQKGSEKDFEQAIKRATNSVQSWWKRETGDTSLPDASNLDDLLVEATAWLTASEATYSFGWNFSGEGGQGNRVNTAEDKAEKKFQQWADQRDVAENEAATEGEVTDAKAQSGSLIDEF